MQIKAINIAGVACDQLEDTLDKITNEELILCFINYYLLTKSELNLL